MFTWGTRVLTSMIRQHGTIMKQNESGLGNQCPVWQQILIMARITMIIGEASARFHNRNVKTEYHQCAMADDVNGR